MCCVDVTVVGRLCCARLLGGVLRRLNLGISGGGGGQERGEGERKNPSQTRKKKKPLTLGGLYGA